MSDPTDRLRSHIVEGHDSGDRLLVLLHGYALAATDLTDRLALLDPDGACTVVVPEAPFEHKGAAIWHRGIATSPELASVQYRESIGLLDDLLGRLEHDTGLAAAEAIVGGFSQGGGLAFGLLLAAGLQHRPAAVFGICSFPPVFDGFVMDPAAPVGRHCFLASAHRDHFAGIESSRAGACALRDTGMDLTYVEVDSGHEMTDEAATLAGRWISRVAAGEAPDGFDDLLSRVGEGPGSFAGRWSTG